ncbi:hypothetical protein P167DRAFT_552247 [Morchella conica CCBAS932]|uniref:HTH La-type RNA-binding domain-containing protein n=1 Tax=Morchella conica CCBAS932 TaxID=1392247 RepID=A0A3N4KWU5_9PEZI|nr:hypothetical protein P167DRAFT_552247 [Morchella conica CCBAS932]
MTTTSASRPINSSEATFSYAAAASGKNSASPAPANKPQTAGLSKPTVPSSNVAGTSVTPATGTSTPQSTSITDSHLKTNGDAIAQSSSAVSSPNLGVGSAPTLPKEDESASSMSEDKGSSWEKQSQTAGSRTPDISKVTDLVPAALPAVNPWKPSPTTPASPSNAIVAKDNVDKSPFGEGSDVAEKERSKEGSSGKSTDAGRANGFASKEDGPAIRKTPKRYPPPEKEATAPVLPPPIAQDEVEKAKRDKDEKDKPASSVLRPGRGSTWVPVAITIPHVPPFAKQPGRGGKGARGGRDGSSRGGLSTHTGSTFGAGVAVEGDRGRQGSNSGASRGAYQGRPGKRATSAGGTTQRREKDSAVSPETASAGTQTHDRARQGSRSDDPNFVPQDRTHHNANGHYHPRERVYNNQSFNSNRPEHHGGDNASSHGPGERGRGNFYNQQHINGHNGAHHQNPGPHFTSTPPHFNAHQTNGQYPAQNSQSSQRPFRGSRSHQGPNNGNYSNRYPNPNMQPPPQIYMPSYPLPYDFSMISPTGIPPPIEYAGISEIIAQIEYYFSVDNLCKDVWLRERMDSDGFVKLSLVAGFPRIRNLTTDMNILREACLRSHEIQIAHGVDEFHVRKAVGWETWILSEKERDPSAQCDQSSWQIDPRQRSQQNSNSGSPLEMSGSAAPFMPGPIRGQGQNAITPGAPPFVPSGIFPPVFATTPLSANVPEFSPNGAVYLNGTAENSRPVPDEFFIEDSQRLVVVTRRPGHTSPLGSPSMSGINGVGTNGSTSAIVNRPSFGLDSEVGWLLKEDNQSLESDSYIHRLYPHALLQAQQQRESSGATKNSEMITLYKFWSHFLCAKFNNLMYEDFRRYAFSDADASQRFGLECIYKFYENGLVTREHFHDKLIQDLVALVKKDVKNGQDLGLEKLKSFLSNPQLSVERKQKIESFVDSELQFVLQNGVESKDGLVESYAAVRDAYTL